MILGIAYSINGVPIRLTEERWEHILDEHAADFNHHDYEMAFDAVEDPEYISLAGRGALFAIVSLGRRRFLHVMYREVTESDGFIITALSIRRRTDAKLYGAETTGNYRRRVA